MILSKSSNMMAEDGRLATNEAKESRKQWYSVREAAEYLAVSQPTIFRWMKEGHLSFYKVGGSHEVLHRRASMLLLKRQRD